MKKLHENFIFLLKQGNNDDLIKAFKCPVEAINKALEYSDGLVYIETVLVYTALKIFKK